MHYTEITRTNWYSSMNDNEIELKRLEQNGYTAIDCFNGDCCKNQTSI
jgi:hypothetical protein